MFPALREAGRGRGEMEAGRGLGSRSMQFSRIAKGSNFLPNDM